MYFRHFQLTAVTPFSLLGWQILELVGPAGDIDHAAVVADSVCDDAHCDLVAERLRPSAYTHRIVMLLVTLSIPADELEQQIGPAIVHV
jgi:hypothetical protein